MHDRSRVILFGCSLLAACALLADCSTPGGVDPAEKMTGPQSVASAQRSSSGEGVRVLLAASRFTERENIRLEIFNGAGETVYTEDLKTDCTIVTLEKQIGSDWETVWGCGMERLAVVVAIEPGESIDVEIRPTSSHILPEPGLRPGTYRALFSYRTASGPEGEEPLKVLSERFTIEE